MEDLITIEKYLTPGDVVELSWPGKEPYLAVYVQQVQRTNQFYTIQGRWTHGHLNDISYAITGCVDPTLLSTLFPYLPTDPDNVDIKGEVHVPAQIGAPVQQVLHNLTLEAEKVYRGNAQILDTAYSLLADSTRMRMMTLTQITKALLSRGNANWDPSPPELLAVRKSLNRNGFRFRSDRRSQRLTNVYSIRPSEHVEMVERVHGWIRDYQEYRALTHEKLNDKMLKQPQGAIYVQQFLAKTRRLVAQSRKDRDATDTYIGPSKVGSTSIGPESRFKTEWSESFSSRDRQIIEFIKAWCLTSQFGQSANYQSASCALIAATGLYKPGSVALIAKTDHITDLISTNLGLVFLQEIGVCSPFENRYLYDESLMLPNFQSSSNVEVLRTKADLLKKDPDFVDSMACMRRDFGSQTVYCIDDAGAKEIDDGISIERVKQKPSEMWLHVHVANPTAFFDKTHALSGLAAHMTETVYTPEKTFSMLPEWVTQGFFSLRANRPVLTFSSRIDAEGKVLETKIQPGTIRNVVTLSPGNLAEIFGDTIDSEMKSLIVGGEVPPGTPRQPPNLTNAQIEDLQDMFRVTKAMASRRIDSATVRHRDAVPAVQVYESSKSVGLTPIPLSLDRARFIKGDPIIALTCYADEKGSLTMDMSYFKSTNIVEEAMLSACAAAASWCAERNIPALFRGTTSRVDLFEADNPHEKIKAIVRKEAEERGTIPAQLIDKFLETIGRTIMHSAPFPHKTLGLPSYMRVTSPLRRFTDMIGHWQIEAALRYEHRTGQKFNYTNHPRGILPFTQRQIADSIITLSPRIKLIQNVKKNVVAFWSAVALMRAWHFKETPIPETFKFYVRFKVEEKWADGQGFLTEYGIQANLVDAPGAQIGDVWEVKIKAIHAHVGRLHVVPVRLLSRDDN